MTGYDVKRIIADSETLPWTANNNQIYRALVQLHDDNWVSKSVEDQMGSPNRHVYTITEKGRQALKDWAKSAPKPPQTKMPFLNQLMWADCLDAQEIDELMEQAADTYQLLQSAGVSILYAPVGTAEYW